MYEQALEKLAHNLTPKRFCHSLGVSETAARLALKYGINVEKARLTGLLHDCARELPNNNLLQMAEAFGIVVNDVERCEPVLLHAPVGAQLMRTEYGFNDAEALQAVCLHTTGGEDMTALAKIIYLADMIEPNRNYPGVDKLRSLSEQDLDTAMLAAFTQSLQYIILRGGLIHPATVAGRNALLIQQRF